MPLWLHFVPWHFLLWLALPFVALAAGWVFATEETAALLKKVPLSWWILAAVIVAGTLYHVATVASAAHAATTAADAAWTAKLDKANKAAKADHDALQAKIDAEAKPSNEALHEQFAQLQARLDAMKAADQARYRPPKPLPQDCKLDPARVAELNAALAQ